MGWIRSRIGNGPCRKAHGPFHSDVTFFETSISCHSFVSNMEYSNPSTVLSSRHPKRLCCGRSRAFAAMPKTVGSTGIVTPTKAAIVRDFNLRGGAKVRGAATATHDVRNVLQKHVFLYSVRSPHRITKPSRGRLRVVGLKVTKPFPPCK